MRINKKRQEIMIKALKTYRDKQISMYIDANDTKELLDDIINEKERIELLEQQKKEKEKDQRNPQTGEVEKVQVQALAIVKEDGMYHVVNLVNLKTIKIFDSKEKAQQFKQKISNWKHVRKFK